uniref:Uncharacterized protein n=1 Tax=Mola mola TaxID=94237 RepID=A0A3Q4ABK4_MOLML
MENFRQTYLLLCKEGGVEPQESVVAQLKESRASQGYKLDLSGQSLSADSCCVLAQAFRNDTVFIEVSFSDCMLSEEAQVLLTGLFENTTIKVLDLKGNNLRSKGAEVLGKLLARNKTLRLVLEWNALGEWDEAFSLFCEGLASNNVLTQLDLRNNQINHHGASELALAIKHNNTIEVLDLRWNNIGLLGGRSLLKALQKNMDIVKLEMAGNNIPSDTLRALQTIVHNLDRWSTIRENRSRSQVFTMEINTLKEEKSWQSLMETIDRQKEEMGRSSSIRIGQLQEALNERKSAVSSLTALQMTEAALALCEQKKQNMGELLARVKAENEEQRDHQSRARKKEQEDSALREGKLSKEIQTLTETNIQLKNKVEEMDCRCKCLQQQIFDLKQELTNKTAEQKLRLVQAERLEKERQRSKQALENMESLRQKEQVEHGNRHLEESEKTLQDHIFKLEGQRIQLEEEHVSSLEDKLHSVHSSLQEVQLHCSQQKHTIFELQVKNSQQSTEMDSLRHKIEELQQDLSGKDQERVAEVSCVRLELQEQTGHLNAEKTAKEALKEKISALERKIKLSNNHIEALLDKESEMSSMLQKLRLKEGEIQRMREDEAHRASCLQSAILAYVQGSPLGHCSNPK